jgi:Peroxidase
VSIFSKETKIQESNTEPFDGTFFKQSGGPAWELPLGRKDSKSASLNGANANIPPPNSTIQNLITLFARQGLDQVDLAALSGKSIYIL